MKIKTDAKMEQNFSRKVKYIRLISMLIILNQELSETKGL
jgi:hypothetical protein